MHIRATITALALAVLPCATRAGGKSVDGYRHAATDPAVTRAEAGLRAAREDVVQAEARRLPTIGWRAGWSHKLVHDHALAWDRLRRGDVGEAPSVAASHGLTTRTMSLHVAVPVWNEEARQDVLASRAALAARHARLEAEGLAAAARFARARLTVEVARERQRIASDSERNLQAVARLARLRGEVGTLGFGGVAEAAARHASSVNDLADASVRLADALVALGLLGGAGSTRGAPGAAGSVMPAACVSTGEQASRMSLSHPRVEAARHDIATAHHRVASMRAALLPTVTLQAAYATTTSWALHGGRSAARVPNNGRPVASVAITFAMPLGESLRGSSRLRQAIHRLDQRQDDMAIVRTEVDVAARRALRRVQSSVRIVRAQRDALEAVNGSTAAATAGLSVGLRSMSDLLAAETRVVSQRLAYLGAREVHEGNAISLWEAIGGCWSPRVPGVEKHLERRSTPGWLRHFSANTAARQATDRQ
ncbi:TolC family protein [Bacillus sp. NP157]|nr:TolC family protein [Bacillus sp. NP157]